MARTRLALALGAMALAAVMLVQGAAAAAPTAITGPVSAVGGSSATLNGTVNPGGAATEWWFEYGTSTSYGSATPHTNAGSGSANVPVSRALTGLSAATTYHYRLVAKNASGTANGGDGLFTTASPPVVVTSPATGGRPDLGDARRDGEPERRAHDLVRRVRHVDVVRHEDGDRRCRLGHVRQGGLRRRRRPDGGQDLPLPPRRDELCRNGATARMRRS